MSDKITPTGEFIIGMSERFNTAAVPLRAKVEETLTALAGDKSDTSNPVLLADYQAALSAYTLFCNAQSSTVKAYKDIAAATISNFR
ncbi:type III secretion system needle filament subunit SctF [Rouxiella silvae]|nr:type III secretion system needle filament subunit SctF [Rouxiella silvae]